MGNQIAKRASRVFVVGVLLVCIPLTARADAGTPLIWATIIHLVIGNFFIGIFEGFILAWIFKLKKRLCVITMIFANYFSAWVGGLFINNAITTHLPLDLYNAWRWIWVMVFLTFLITLVFEWPFVFFCFRKEQGRIVKSLKGNLLVNSLSYVFLFGWYWMASGVTLYTKMNIVRPTEMTFPKEGIIYFISNGDDVYKYDFTSRLTEKVVALKANDEDRLYVKRSPIGSNNWDILDSTKNTLICSNLAVSATEYERDTNTPVRIMDGWMNFGGIPQLGSAKTSDWTFGAGFWAIEGLHGHNQKTKDEIYFSLETPFAQWRIRNATQLPNDYVVFQLGEDQICLLEIATRKIALLAKGQGPVVVLPRGT